MKTPPLLPPFLVQLGKRTAIAVLALHFLNPLGSAAIISPTEVAGLRLWLDSRTGVNTTEENRISEWADQSSGTSYNATPPSTERAPLYTASGTPALSFDGTSQLRAPGAQTSMQNEMTAFVVVSLAKLGENQLFLDDKNGASSNPGFYLGLRSNNRVEFRVIDKTFQNTNLNQTATLPTGYTSGYLVIMARVESNGTTTLRVAEQTATTPNTLSLENIQGTSAFSIGSMSAGGWELNGEIASVLLYDRALSNADADEVYDYLYSIYVVPEPHVALFAGLGALFVVVVGTRTRRVAEAGLENAA